MVRINDISKAMAYFETEIKNLQNDRDEYDYSPEKRMERARQKAHYATTVEALRLLLAYPEATLALYKKSIRGA